MAALGTLLRFNERFVGWRDFTGGQLLLGLTLIENPPFFVLPCELLCRGAILVPHSKSKGKSMRSDQNESLLTQAMTATMLLCGQLRGSELRVLHALMIEGLLMGKSRVKVSYTRIAAIAGVARPVASKAINRLVDLGYVVDDEGAWKIDIDLLHRRAADVRSDLFPSAA